MGVKARSHTSSHVVPSPRSTLKPLPLPLPLVGQSWLGLGTTELHQRAKPSAKVNRVSTLRRTAPQYYVYQHPPLCLCSIGPRLLQLLSTWPAEKYRPASPSPPPATPLTIATSPRAASIFPPSFFDLDLRLFSFHPGLWRALPFARPPRHY